MAKKLSSSFFLNKSKSTSSSNGLQNSRCACDDVTPKTIESGKSDDEVEEPLEHVDKKKSLWETILQESKERAAPYEAWLKEREEITTEDVDSPAYYLNREIFPTLLPAMEEMLRQARLWNALAVQRCSFSGLDYLAEYLWNKNPRWPRRNLGWLKVFDIPQFKLLMRLKPRPIFPKSWLWSEDEAALILQRSVRGWLIRKREDVQELRQFWKAIKADNGSLDNDESKTNSPVLDICGRYKLSAKKRERPF